MAKFCGKCGTRLDDKTGQCPNCNKRTNILKWIAVVIGIVVLCVTVCAVILLERVWMIPEATEESAIMTEVEPETKASSKESNAFAFLPSQFDVYCCAADGYYGSELNPDGTDARSPGLNLNPDGTFTYVAYGGNPLQGYTRTGSIEKYEGKFTNLTQVDELTYKMSLEYIEQLDLIGREYNEDWTKFFAENTNRFEGEKEAYIYLPGTEYTYENNAVSTRGKYLFEINPSHTQLEDVLAHGYVIHIEGLLSVVCEPRGTGIICNDNEPFSIFPRSFQFISTHNNHLSADLNLNSDGTFIHEIRRYTACTMEDYSLSISVTKYFGKFTDLTQIDDFTYRMSLEYLEAAPASGEHIENGIQYVIEDGEPIFDSHGYIYIYLPGSDFENQADGKYVTMGDGEEVFMETYASIERESLTCNYVLCDSNNVKVFLGEPVRYPAQ